MNQLCNILGDLHEYRIIALMDEFLQQGLSVFGITYRVSKNETLAPLLPKCDEPDAGNIEIVHPLLKQGKGQAVVSILLEIGKTLFKGE